MLRVELHRHVKSSATLFRHLETATAGTSLPIKDKESLLPKPLLLEFKRKSSG